MQLLPNLSTPVERRTVATGPNGLEASVLAGPFIPFEGAEASLTIIPWIPFDGAEASVLAGPFIPFED